MTIEPFEKVLARYGATVADKTDLKRNILKRVFYCVSRIIHKSHSFIFLLYSRAEDYIGSSLQLHIIL